jgi:hypothetical protein
MLLAELETKFSSSAGLREQRWKPNVTTIIASRTLGHEFHGITTGMHMRICQTSKEIYMGPDPRVISLWNGGGSRVFATAADVRSLSANDPP